MSDRSRIMGSENPLVRIPMVFYIIFTAKVIILGNNHLRQSNFSKGLTKLAILPDYKCRRMLYLLALPPLSKIGPDFSNKVVLKVTKKAF